jgi:uncharacterized protein with GYD domain
MQNPHFFCRVDRLRAEGPDDETATKLAMTIAAAGAVRTETFRVFTEDEYRKMISELP